MLLISALVGPFSDRKKKLETIISFFTITVSQIRKLCYRLAGPLWQEIGQMMISWVSENLL